MTRPIIIVNCKTYPQATGERAVRLAKLCETYAREHKADIRIAVQTTDIALVAKAVRIPVYAQHVDVQPAGKSTGWTTVQAIKKAGAKGCLVNHAEHRIPSAQVKETAEHLRRAKLDAIIIAEDIARLREFDKHISYGIFCVEPPELIGGEVSVSVARPDVVAGAVHSTRRPLLIGAGIKDRNDLDIALSLGAKGVLLSSGIVLAKNQAKALAGLLG